MLLILSRLAPAFGWRLTVAHFDHRLRGREEAEADSAFVSGLASSLGLPFVSGTGDVARRARARHESVEQAARVLRYRFLGAQARAAGATAVAVGHTLDDQAETVLLHIVRGSGLDGLAGMRPRSGWPVGNGPEVARPLLELRRRDTGRYCRDLGIHPREDATNELLLATRNRVRHEVMPALRALNPRVEEALARLADAASAELAELETLAEEALAIAGRREKGTVQLDLETLRRLGGGIRSRVLRRALAVVLGSDAGIEASHLEALAQLVGSRPGRLSLPRGIVGLRDSRTLTLRRGEPEVPEEIPEMQLEVPGVTEAGRWRIETKVVQQRAGGKRGRALEVYLDADAVAGGLRVRSRRPGDRMRPRGLGGTKKLQDILVDAKVPRAARDGLPVLVADWGIAWVAGVCVDERAAGGSGPLLRIAAEKR
jgi:tRNA(Ile)-lysidine synthase